MQRQNDFVVIPIIVEHLLSDILGSRATRGIPEGCPIKYWRELCQKLVNHLEQYIDVNLETDKLHRQLIQYQLDSMKKGLEGKVGKEREPRFVVALVRMCLLLLGDLPAHHFKRVINRRDYYRLHGVRTVHYTQTRAQKRVTIQREIQRGSFKGVKKEDAFQFGFKTRKMSDQKFLDLIQSTYPQEYQRLF